MGDRKIGPTPVVNQEEYQDFYGKYKWVVKGSVRFPGKDVKRALKVKPGGLVCDIKCIDTGKLRTVKVQDAFQVKRTKEAQLKFRRKQDLASVKAKRKLAKSK